MVLGICLENCPFYPDLPVLLSIGFYFFKVRHNGFLFCFVFFRISSVSVVMSPFSFLILLIWILSLCPPVSLAKGLVIWEMKVKMTQRFHLTPVRMAKIKNSGESRCWQGCGERTLLHCWWDCKLVQPLSLAVPQKIGHSAYLRTPRRYSNM